MIFSRVHQATLIPNPTASWSSFEQFRWYFLASIKRRWYRIKMIIQQTLFCWKCFVVFNKKDDIFLIVYFVSVIIRNRHV
jgi:outer membrane receptor for monomeric catechols